MDELLQPSPAPELFFGLVAPIGVDLDLITEILSQLLTEMRYNACEIRLTKLMRDVPTGMPIANSPHVQSYKDRIAYANEVRSRLGDDSLAALAVSAIRTFREEEWNRLAGEEVSVQTVKDSPEKTAEGEDAPSDSLDNPNLGGKSFEETPLSHQAYIIRQFKRPEEVALLRRVYGRQFILVSAYSPQEVRRQRIEQRERQSRGGLIKDVEAQNLANELVVQDAKETLEDHGQNVRDAFPLGDVFIDATSREACEATLQHFVYLLFGNNHITPTYDEYGMYMAKSASLRSSDLSRQIGAAIFQASGEVVSLGCNEVPKPGGGTYWSGDPKDKRDFVEGYDPNEQRKTELLVDILDRLKNGGHLSESLMAVEDSHEVCKQLLSEESSSSVAESQIMDLLEFGRIIHAEMSAICDASRKGTPVEGTILYCTTFPCHICAKHIVASGIKKVVYLEPYPKSYAWELHRDSIEIETNASENKVSFVPFIGVSPFRYRELFEKGKRKYSGGIAQKWNKGSMRPMIEVHYPSYFESEIIVVKHIKEKLESMISESSETGEETKNQDL